MTAKEMFEKIGYVYVYGVTYEKDLGNRYRKRIGFMQHSEHIRVLVFDVNGNNYETHIEPAEIKAINKQVEELGWGK